jgi:hypothetical protein
MTAAKTNGTAPKGLHAKLAEVMSEAGRIPKNGTYTGQGGFKYVLVGDAADAIRKALGERGVSMLPTAVEVVSEAEHATKSGGTMTTLTIRTTWTLTDAETGLSALIQSIGTGADAGDKASPKAQTNAMKYALLMGFLLSTGDDPEQSDSTDRRQRPVGQHEAPPNRPELVRTTGTDGLIGKVATSGTQDFMLRQTPDGGFVLPFRVKEGNRAGQIVIAEDDLAVALDRERDNVLGKIVTVWGTYSDEESPPKADGYVVRFKVLHLERISTPDFILPSPITDSPLPSAVEAASEALPWEPLDEDERAAVGAGLPDA